MKKKGGDSSTGMEDDGTILYQVNRQLDMAEEAEQKIARIVSRFKDVGKSSSNADSGSSGLSSKAKSSNERDKKYIKKISDQIRQHADMTATRLIKMLAEVSDVKTLMIKAKTQQLMHLQTEDPRGFLSTIENPDYSMIEYAQWTENDHLGYYILSHFYNYGFYRQPLIQSGQERAYFKYMVNEILNALTNTPLLQQFDAFVKRNAYEIAELGITPDELYNGVKVKFYTELASLYELRVDMPVKVRFSNVNNGQMQVFSFPDAFVLMRDFLSSSGFAAQEHGIRQIMHQLQQQIAQVSGIQIQSYAGGAKKSKKSDSFHFPRYSKLGRKKPLFME